MRNDSVMEKDTISMEEYQFADKEEDGLKISQHGVATD